MQFRTKKKVDSAAPLLDAHAKVLELVFFFGLIGWPAGFSLQAATMEAREKGVKWWGVASQ